jgi:DNA repair protein RadC
VDFRLVFRRLLDAQAYAFICVHNHPTGDLTPSREDKDLTDRLTEAGKMIGIQLLDHLIVSSEGFFAFSENF